MRPVLQLHTIEQWYSVPLEVQQAVLQGLKVRDRLWAHRLMKEKKMQETIPEPHWVPCRKCDQRGWRWKHGRKAGIHPSAMYSPCLLKIWNEAMGIEGDVVHDARELLLFDTGSYIHDLLQDCGLNGAWGDYYVPEIAIEDTPEAQELMVVGHADADNIIVVDDIPGAPIIEVGIVHEYKSINDNGYESLKGKPKAQHKMQATIYSACLNRPVVVYLYFNKNNSNIQDFPVVFDHQVWGMMKKKITAVRDFVLSQTPPPAEVGYHCSQCAYVFKCEAYQASKKKGA